MPTTWTLEDLYRGIARGWKALAITVVICLTVAYVAFRLFPEQYAATAVHTVEPISVLSDGSSFSTVNMDTEQVVATSTGVLEAAAEGLGADISVRDLRDAVELEVPQGSQILRFVVTTPSPARSADWANAIATAYGQQRSEAARAVVQQTSDELQATIDDLRAALDGETAGSPEAAATELQLEALVAEQARLLATPFYAGSLITPAVEPIDSTRPSVLVFVAGGLFLGLLLGSFAALLWAGRDARHDETPDARPSSRHAAPWFARRSDPALRPTFGPVRKPSAAQPASEIDDEQAGSDRAAAPEDETASEHRDEAASERDNGSVGATQRGTRVGRGLPRPSSRARTASRTRRGSHFRVH